MLVCSILKQFKVRKTSKTKLITNNNKKELRKQSEWVLSLWKQTVEKRLFLRFSGFQSQLLFCPFSFGEAKRRRLQQILSKSVYREHGPYFFKDLELWRHQKWCWFRNLPHKQQPTEESEHDENKGMSMRKTWDNQLCWNARRKMLQCYKIKV